jgi:hypothetical protein
LVIESINKQPAQQITNKQIINLKNRMKKVILTFFVLAITTASALRAQDSEHINPIYTGIHSLSITPDARAGGMGDVGAATRPDIFSQHWNPSKYAFMESPAGLAFSYTPWLRSLVDDIGLFYMAGFWKIDDFQAFSASMRYFSLGEIRMMQHANDVSGLTAKPNEFAFDLAYSRRLSETFSASVAFRYIRGDLHVPAMAGQPDMFPANAFAADISAFYTTPVTMASGDGNLSFGANISNIGSKVSYDEGSTSNFLPTNFRLGGSFDMPFDDFNRLSISADANKLLVISRHGRFMEGKAPEEFSNATLLQSIFGSFSDGDFGQRITWSLGAEYAYNNQFFLRAGYFNEHRINGGRKFFTAGAGFKLNVFQLDAGYVIATTPTNPLDATLRFSLSFDFDGLRNLFD